MSCDGIVIVGGGIIGAAIAHALSHRSLGPVTLLEQGTFGGGVTAASGAMTRVYHPEPVLSDLARTGFAGYEAFRRESGDSCGFVETGMLFLTDAQEHARLERECRRLATTDYPINVLNVDEGRQHFPDLDWSDGVVAVHEPRAGYSDPVRTTRALIRAARRRGIQAHDHSPVDRVETREGRTAGVWSAGEFIPAETLILASGGWSAPLLNPLGIDVGLYLKAIQTIRLEGTSWVDHPCFFDTRHDSFGRPDTGTASRVGVVVGDRHPVPGLLPLDPEAADRAHAAVARRFPFMAGRIPAGGVKTVDSYVTDRLGLAEFAPELPGLFLCLGWGGTGFKVAPALGSLAADALLRQQERALTCPM
jgi:glycine/D-amino acid oxidase-like deaminating enzyme